MWTYPHETADLVTFTAEIPNGKLHYFCSASNVFEKDFMTAPINFILFFQAYKRKTKCQNIQGSTYSNITNY